MSTALAVPALIPNSATTLTTPTDAARARGLILNKKSTLQSQRRADARRLRILSVGNLRRSGHPLARPFGPRLDFGDVPGWLTSTQPEPGISRNTETLARTFDNVRARAL